MTYGAEGKNFVINEFFDQFNKQPISVFGINKILNEMLIGLVTIGNYANWSMTRIGQVSVGQFPIWLKKIWSLNRTPYATIA